MDDVGHGHGPLGPGHHLPLHLSRRDAIGRAVDDDSRRVQVVAVDHSRGGRRVVEEVHDSRRRRVDAQRGDDVLARVVELVGPIGGRAAVGSDVAAYRAHRPLLGHHHGAFPGREGALAPHAGRRVVADPSRVDDVGPARAALGDARLVASPAVPEVDRVVGRRDHRVLGIRPLAGVVLLLVGLADRQQVETVLHRVGPRPRAKAPVAAEEIDVPHRSIERVGHLDLDAAPRDRSGWLPRRGSLVPRFTRHEHQLVVGIEPGIRVGPGPGRRIGVGEDLEPRGDEEVVKRDVVDDGEVHVRAFVHLHRDPDPADLGLAAERHDGVGPSPLE